MSSSFNHQPDRVLAIVTALVLTCITFSSTLELFSPLGGQPGLVSFIA